MHGAKKPLDHSVIEGLELQLDSYATPEQAQETLQRFIDSYTDPHFYGWGIEREGRMIGTFGAYDYDPEKNQIEIGFSIERASWAKAMPPRRCRQCWNI